MKAEMISAFGGAVTAAIFRGVGLSFTARPSSEFISHLRANLNLRKRCYFGACLPGKRRDRQPPESSQLSFVDCARSSCAA